MKLQITDTNGKMIQHNSVLSNINEYGSRYEVCFKNGSFGMYGSHNDFIPLSEWNLGLFKIVTNVKNNYDNNFKDTVFAIDTDMNGNTIYNNSKLIFSDKSSFTHPEDTEFTVDILFENGSWGLDGKYGFSPLYHCNLSLYRVA